MRHKLDPDIVKYLTGKLDLKKSTIEKNISLLKRRHPKCTSNAVAHIYAQQFGVSVLGKLSKEDKETLPHLEVEKSKIKINSKRIKKKEKIIEFIKYESNDYFIKGHISEANRAYSKGCYTCVYILSRKIIENLIIDLLKNKFPPNSLENKNLYFDTNQNRFKDFGEVLNNLLKKKNDFGVGKGKTVESLYKNALKLKNDANDRTHSWFYLVERKVEIDDIKIQTIVELIINLNNHFIEGEIK